MSVAFNSINKHIETAAETRTQFIYTTIRERITFLEYVPGSRLTETFLAKEFNVSRTPIRRVLGKLEDEGLVEVRHGAGNFVTEVKLKELCKVYRLRAQLTLLIPRLNPKPVTEELLSQARHLQRQCLDIENSAHPKTEYAKVNLKAFKLYMQIVGNPPLVDAFERLFYIGARMWPYLLDDVSVVVESRRFAEENQSLTRLLEAGDIDATFKLSSSQIDNARRRMIVATVKTEEAQSINTDNL